MTNQNISSKKLKAIVFTDIVNFTKLSSKDEQYALNLIDKQREILKPIVSKYKGEWLKEIGDGLLLSFDSSLEAVRCSIDMQNELKEINDLDIRIGIHQGDIFVKNGDVFGDDVNIASRVEGFSPIGGISLSDKVYKDISGVSDIKTSFIGHKTLKGVEQETQIRCITSHNLPKIKSSKLIAIIGYFSYLIGLFFIGIGISVGLNDNDGVVTILLALWGVQILISGYNCFAYVKGLSIKSQRYSIYITGALVLFTIFIFLLGVKEGFVE